MLVFVDSLYISCGGSTASTLPRWQRVDLTLMGCFLAISPKVGTYRISRSDLELNKSVENLEAMNTCSLLITDSLFCGQFEISAILHVQGNVSKPYRIYVYYNKLLLRLMARLFSNYG